MKYKITKKNLELRIFFKFKFRFTQLDGNRKPPFHKGGYWGVRTEGISWRTFSPKRTL